MKTLILTDNHRALQLAGELGERYGKIDIFQSPPSELDGVPTLDVRVNCQRIADEYGLVISIHCKQIFPPALVTGTRCVNVHPGFNPHNRGWYPQVFSLLDGQPAGVTVHEIDTELDHGAIIVQRAYTLKPWDTSGSAYDALMQIEYELMLEWFERIRDHDYAARPPDEEGNLNLRRDFEALRELDLDEVGRFGAFLDRLRALSHPPFHNAFFRDESGRRVYVRAELEPDTDETTDDD